MYSTDKVPGGSMRQVVGVVGLPSNSYKPITNTAWVPARLSKLQKRCTRLASASDKAYQLLAHGRWFSPGTPASSTTKTGCHDIAEILLKVALSTKNQSIKKSIYSTDILCASTKHHIQSQTVFVLLSVPQRESFIYLLNKTFC